jgi:hypothetical protein
MRILLSILSLVFATSVFAAEVSLPAANGAYGGIDALGRTLSLQSPEVPMPKNDRYVGLFYFSWLAQHGKNGPYDITKIVKENPDAIQDATHPAWGPLHAYHHWGQSIFGYYTSDDAWVKRKHVQMLTDAGIDFLIIDATNAAPYINQGLQLMEILDEYQKQGWNVPKMVFYTNSSSGKTIETLYKEIYQKNRYPNLWFHWEGKPMIVGHPEECSDEIKEFFRIKKSQWPNEEKFHDDGFPWIAFERPQHVFKNVNGENEVVNVSVAQHNGTIRFSSSAFYGDQTNWTRSWRNGQNDPAPDAYKYGYNFIEQYEHAIKQDPKIVFITGWNEWIAMIFKGPVAHEPVMFVDLCDTNSSRDIEPMVGGFGDNYYMQMIEFNRKYKGVQPPQENMKPATINIDGQFSQWNQTGIPAFKDYVNDIPDRDVQGYGELHYTNKTGRNDFDTMKVTEDKNNIYFYAKTVDPITKPDKHWMSLFIRTSSAKTDNAWEGYDFVVNRVAPSDGKAVLERSNGGWNWKEAEKVAMKVEGNELHLAIPKKALGMTESRKVTFQFKWADNYQGEGDINSFYLDGDAAPLGRLNYVFHNPSIIIPAKREPSVLFLIKKISQRTQGKNGILLPLRSIISRPSFHFPFHLLRIPAFICRHGQKPE